MSGTNTPTKQASPKEWPEAVAKLYDPVRILGTGGFASAMLARKKSPGPNEEKLVAIKIVGTKQVQVELIRLGLCSARNQNSQGNQPPKYHESR
jgi:hypothetical protein